MKLPYKTSISDEAVLDEYLALVREAGPPPLPETDARRMVRRAMIAGEGRRRSRAQTWRLAVAASATLAVFAGVWVVRDAETRKRGTAAVATPDGKPLKMRLPSDDVVVASAGARFRLRSATRDKRLVDLSGGAMLFEVIPLETGQRFEVNTPHARVGVRGTVFTVQVTSSRTAVRVYQGRVQVQTGVASRTLLPGESYTSDGTAPGANADAPLYSEALAAVRRRETAIRDQAIARTASEVDSDRAGQGDLGSIPDPAQAPPPPHPPSPTPPDAPEDISVKPLQTTPRQARARLNRGHPRNALRAAREALRAGTDQQGSWAMLEADALRALGHFPEAAEGYQRACPLLPPGKREQAGYLAASIYFKQLDRPQRALQVLDSAGVDAVASPLRERALLLRARVLQRLDCSPKDIACRYLDDYPQSVGADLMRPHCPKPPAAAAK